MRRRNRAGLKKIGLLALAMIFALGTLGVTYSAWTKVLYVNSMVYTGNVDIDITAVSSTFAYKVPGLGDIGYGLDTDVHYVDSDVDPDPYTPPDGELIASAVTTFDNSGDEDLSTMTLSGLFPCIDFQTDLQLSYTGTVPGIVSVAIIYPNDPGDTVLTYLWNRGKATKGTANPEGIWLDGFINRNDGKGFVKVEEPEGLQLHRFDRAHVTLHVHLPEDPAYAGLPVMYFTGIINVIQWNEYAGP